MIFVGSVPDQDLPEFYALCDIFVLLNREEPSGDVKGFGMVFLEASASGKAVIGGRSGGATEAVLHGTSGLSVDPYNVEEVAQRLKELLLNPALREQHGRAGALRARADFSWESRARRIREVCVEVLSGRD